MPPAVVVIPARWASSRFPGKVLSPLAGRPLVLHACELAARAARRHEEIERQGGPIELLAPIVATDDERVAAVVESAGHRACMTGSQHRSGTDRVAEVARSLEAEIVVVLQADEPFLARADIDALVRALSRPGAEMATLSAPLTDERDWLDPNVVKLVADERGRALYFSRSPIPYSRPSRPPLAFPPRGPVPTAARVHVGVYAFRRDALLAFAEMAPSSLELAEGLEQLRALEAGWTISVLPAQGHPFGIDTPEDMARAEQLFSEIARMNHR